MLGFVPILAVVVIGALLAGFWRVGPFAPGSTGSSPSLPISTTPSSSSSQPILPQSATVRDGDFELTIRSSKTRYEPNESIGIEAAVMYLGERDSVEVAHISGGPVSYGVVERVYGADLSPRLALTDCGSRTTLVRDRPVVDHFDKAGWYAGDAPASESLDAFMQDPELRLPPGTWHVYAVAGLGPICDRQSPTASLRAEITIEVSADASESNVAARVMTDLSGEPQLVGLTTKVTPSGLEVVVTLTRNDDGVPEVWLADLAVGAVAERSHSDQAVANDVVSSATAVGPSKAGDTVTTHLGVGAVRLGQVFGSRSDSELIAHVAEVAERHGLTVADLRILHPLESALSVKFVVPDGATIDWTIDELRTDLVGASPDVEGVFIELGDSHGLPLLQAGVAYRTGAGGLWFAPGQDSRFGAVHGGTPGN